MNVTSLFQIQFDTTLEKDGENIPEGFFFYNEYFQNKNHRIIE